MTRKESSDKDAGDKYLDKDDKEGFVVLLIMGFTFAFQV